MRVIIRFSVNGEKDGALRNKLVAALAAHSIFLQPNTATYELSTKKFAANAIQDALDGFWGEVNQHQGPGTLDHFWMYADHKSDPSPTTKKKSAKRRKDSRP